MDGDSLGPDSLRQAWADGRDELIMSARGQADTKWSDAMVQNRPPEIIPFYVCLHWSDGLGKE